MVQDSTAALNWDRGPFRSAAYFRKALEMAEAYVATASADDEVWCHLLEGMCDDDNDDTSGDFGTVEFGDRQFKNLPFSSCFDKLDDNVKWTRWGSHHWATKAFLPKRHRKLLVLVVQMISSGQKLSDATLMKLGLLAPGQGAAQALYYYYHYYYHYHYHYYYYCYYYY